MYFRNADLTILNNYANDTLKDSIINRTLWQYISHISKELISDLKLFLYDQVIKQTKAA